MSHLRKVIIDCDPGIDDAYAILAAFSFPSIEVLGITTVSGNKSLAVVTPNALRLVNLLDKKTPVYQGAHTNLSMLQAPVIDEGCKASEFHGKDGMGNCNLPYTQDNLQKDAACDFILQQIQLYPNEVEIFALGPLTNIALAIQKNNEAMKKLKAVYSMGGGIHRGNVSLYAEFNYWFDPQAANLMFSAIGYVIPLYMIGLDATHSTLLTYNDIAFFNKKGGKTGQFLHDISQVYFNQYFRSNGYLGGVIHDLMCVLLAMDESIVEPSHIRHTNIHLIEEGEKVGQTVVSEALPPNAFVVMKIRNEQAKQVFVRWMFPDVYEEYLRCCENSKR